MPCSNSPSVDGLVEHEAGDVRRGLGPQVVEVDVALRVGADLDHLVAGHGDGGRVGPVGGVGGEHLGPGLAVVLVERPREQHAGQLAVGARRRLQRDVGQPGDRGQAVLEAPHQLQRALRLPRVLEGVEPGVPVERGDALVELGVVLHRARAQRVEARVEVEVALGQAVVMAHDLGLGDLGKTSSLVLGAAQTGRDEIVERMLGHVERRGHEGAAAGLGALVDRQLVVGRGVASSAGSHVVGVVTAFRGHSAVEQCRRGGRCPRGCASR